MSHDSQAECLLNKASQSFPGDAPCEQAAQLHGVMRPRCTQKSSKELFCSFGGLRKHTPPRRVPNPGCSAQSPAAPSSQLGRFVEEKLRPRPMAVADSEIFLSQSLSDWWSFSLILDLECWIWECLQTRSRLHWHWHVNLERKFVSLKSLTLPNLLYSVTLWIWNKLEEIIFGHYSVIEGTFPDSQSHRWKHSTQHFLTRMV